MCQAQGRQLSLSEDFEGDPVLREDVSCVSRQVQRADGFLDPELSNPTGFFLLIFGMV